MSKQSKCKSEAWKLRQFQSRVYENNFFEVYFSRLVRFTRQWIKLKCLNFDGSKAVFMRVSTMKRSELVINLDFSLQQHDWLTTIYPDTYFHIFLHPQIQSTNPPPAANWNAFLLWGFRRRRKTTQVTKYPVRLELCNNLQFLFTFYFHVWIYDFHVFSFSVNVSKFLLMFTSNSSCCEWNGGIRTEVNVGKTAVGHFHLIVLLDVIN